MTKQRTLPRQPASIHAKTRRAPLTKPVKVTYRPPDTRRASKKRTAG